MADDFWDMKLRRLELPGGFLVYRFAPGNTCEIVDVAVESGQRRHGTGRRLLELLFSEAHGRDCHLIYAVTSADNQIAQQWYEACKFRVLGVLRGFYAIVNRADALVYGRGPKGVV